jgi:hypothetical protein
VALLELEGRFRAGTRRRLGVPRLVAEHADGTHEIAPAAAGEASAEPEGALWRASYAVSLGELGGGVFSLAVGRELLVGLPAPDPAAGTGDREVRLAREANALRRTADEASGAAAAALASVGVERGAREAAEGEIGELRLARDDLSRRVAGLEDELAQVRRGHAAELVRRDEERQAALAGRDEEAARAADERVAETEAEVAEARRALRAARAEAEGFRRELARERERAAAAKGAVRRGRVTAIAGEPVEADPLDVETPTRTESDGDDASPVDGARALSTGDEALAAARAEADEPLAFARAEAHEPRDGARAEADEPRDAAHAEADEPRAGENNEVGPLDKTSPIAASPGETVRVLGVRRPRRTGEGPPADPAPGTAAIGARFIEPGQTAQHRAAVWLTRLLAVAALAVVIVAILLVLKPF